MEAGGVEGWAWEASCSAQASSGRRRLFGREREEKRGEKGWGREEEEESEFVVVVV
jgi:hypothetical protein